MGEPVLLLAIGFFLGGLPLTSWIFRVATGKSLKNLGTGNLSVSAAFLHGGLKAGIPAAVAEAVRGAGVVVAARAFGGAAEWPLLALLALVTGRFWLGRAVGATNAFWGMLVYSLPVTLLATAVGLIPWALQRNRTGRRRGQFVALLALPLALYLQTNQVYVAGAAALLSLWIVYTLFRMPDDLDLTQRQPDRAVPTLADGLLESALVGPKAANLARLHQAGLPVPPGWVLLPGRDPGKLPAAVSPAPGAPWIARSSATSEDTAGSSAAGQYLSVGGIESREALGAAIEQVRSSYLTDAALSYRRDRKLPEGTMAVLVQPQIQGVYSGVLFTRDPVGGQDRLVVEATLGGAMAVVDGTSTPIRLQLERNKTVVADEAGIPGAVLEQLRTTALAVEDCFRGVPQDIEWSFDGEKLWILQARPITTLQPVWTRTIAAEVIPGAIRPLTWSINQPLTTGVWGELFEVVLEKKVSGIDFSETATLLDGWAYFNATLLGDLFRRMGLPSESLDFLLRGSRFTPPPLASVVANLPGLARLAGRDLRLDREFERVDRELLVPLIAGLEAESREKFTARQLVGRAERIQIGLKLVTYYQILAPLGLALRRAVLGVPEDWLEVVTAEVQAVRDLGELAAQARAKLGSRVNGSQEELARLLEGTQVQVQLEDFIRRYGYLSEVGTDIAVPTWQEHPETIHALFRAMVQIPRPPARREGPANPWDRLRAGLCRERARTRARVAQVYDRLLAYLRLNFVQLEQLWLAEARLLEQGDIFFLRQEEIQQLVAGDAPFVVAETIAGRRAEYERQRHRRVPRVVYGDSLPPEEEVEDLPRSDDRPTRLKGIGASRGRVEGTVRVLMTVDTQVRLEPGEVVVVPYTDAGWAPLLAQAAAIIAEVGGKLSHGAIIAREYGLPAVMNVAGATHLLGDGQRVRVDGAAGTVELMD